MDDINLIYQTYNLPEIKREGITDIEYNHRCKYLRLYIRLIKRCQLMTEEELSGYNETHHIQPHCLDGKDNIENLLVMPVRYHIMAHIILFEVYPDNYKVGYAAFQMTNGSGTLERTKVVIGKFSSRTLANIKKNLSVPLSKKYSGEGNPMFGRKGELSPIYGKKQTEEHKRKISEALKGKVRSEEHRKNLSKSLKGRVIDESWRKHISEGGKGRIFSEETKQKMRESLRNSENVKRLPVIGPDGTIYRSINEASRKTGISRHIIGRTIKGIIKSRLGEWKLANS
jgi:hypothetical protein